jgi:hypothetical protein
MKDPNGDKMFLFQYVEPRGKHNSIAFFFGSIPGDEWRQDKDKPEKVLEFFAEVRDLKRAAQLVRTNPNAKWVLFTGKMQEIQVAVPVFINGISLDSFEKEW